MQVNFRDCTVIMNKQDQDSRGQKRKVLRCFSVCARNNIGCLHLLPYTSFSQLVSPCLDCQVFLTSDFIVMEKDLKHADVLYVEILQTKKARIEKSLRFTSQNERDSFVAIIKGRANVFRCLHLS